jgi:hypothetical protein
VGVEDEKECDKEKRADAEFDYSVYRRQIAKEWKCWLTTLKCASANRSALKAQPTKRAYCTIYLLPIAVSNPY